MSNDSEVPPVFRIDVSADASSDAGSTQYDPNVVIITLLRQLIAGQAKQTQILEELVQQQNAVQRQRVAELGQWKQANPGLARACRTAAETLSRVQTQFLTSLTEEVLDNEECLLDGEFMLNEFVDRYGPRLAHLNGVLQVLSQLSSVPLSRQLNALHACWWIWYERPRMTECVWMGHWRCPPLPGAADLDAALLLAGVGGNFYGDPLLERIANRLLQSGIVVLRVNTRGHDWVSIARVGLGTARLGAAFEIVDHCRHDIAAWIEFLQQRGLSRLVLAGHSLGAVKALYAQAHEPSTAVRCLVAISPPRLSHAEFQQGPRSEKFRESLAEAQRHMEEGRPAKLIITRIPVPLVISAATYLDKHGPQERYNFLRFLPRIRCPILFTYGESELARGEPGFNGVTQAIDQTRAAGQIAEVRTVAGADHFYSQAQPVLAEEIIAWLERQLPAS